MTQIVVGVDGSAPSQAALAWALDEARLRDAAVILAHGYRSPEVRHPYAYSYPYLSASLVQRLIDEDQAWRETEEAAVRRQGEAEVERALDAAGGAAGVAVLKQIVVPRDPAELLVDLSRDADLLVVGSRGRGGFTGLLLGSVSQQCMHHAHCPVVVFR